MGKNKLKKFSDMEHMECVFQYPFSVLEEKGFPMRGHWREDFFRNDNPIVLELGCGKGEYTVGLARRHPKQNFIGIDIKGARMWTGASQARDEGLKNVAFLRTHIELLPHFFAPGEVDEIWITFPDPQMKKVRKRLTSTRFMELYRNVVKPDATIRLKSDSPFLYAYTERMAKVNSLPVVASSADLHKSDDPSLPPALKEIRTFYEQQWLDRGLSIKYIEFLLPSDTRLEEVDDTDIPRDTYRSFSRGVLQCPQLLRISDNE